MAVVAVDLPLTTWTPEGGTLSFAKNTRRSSKLIFQQLSMEPTRAGQEKLLPSPAFVETPRTFSMEPPAEPLSSNKKKKFGKRKPTSDIRRSASTPQLANMARTESIPVSPTSDKRRNKLGYHRTSVACGKTFNTFAKLCATHALCARSTIAGLTRCRTL